VKPLASCVFVTSGVASLASAAERKPDGVLRREEVEPMLGGQAVLASPTET
jgi:hypothetical protein